MNCKACSTRLGPGDKTCPHCGASNKKSGLPGAAPLAPARKPPKFASPDTLASLGGLKGAQANDVAKGGAAKKGAATGPAKGAIEGKKKLKKKIKKKFQKPRVEPVAVAPTPVSTSPAKPRTEPAAAPTPPAPASAGVSSVELRSLIVSEPDRLEEGLEVFTDGKGRRVGANYSSEVGDIDLLARDAEGNPVVVMVAEDKPNEQLVAELLKRIGWVRKHLSAKSENVRGIVVLESPSEEVQYAAAAVAGTITFKTYQMRIVFEDIPD